MALPSAVTFGTVVAKFLIATADSPDDSDRDPEGNPATGLTVTFSPSLDKPIARLASAAPPVIFAIADVPATIGSDGTLRGSDGQPGVKLVAGMNPLLDPYGWPWQVTISGAGFPKLSFSFPLNGGDTVDLASVVQVPAAPGQTLAQWLGAVTDAQAARDAAAASAAAAAASLAAASATYLPLSGGTLDGGSASTVFAPGGPGPITAVTTVDNGDGTFTSSGTGAVDNGDGTFTLTDITVTDNGDGTFTLAA